MAARLITARLQSQLVRASSAGVTGSHRSSRKVLAGDILEAVVSTSGLQTYYWSHDGRESAKSSSGSFWWRLHHSKILFGISTFHLSDAAIGSIARAPGIARSPRVDIRQQHSDQWLVQHALADADRRRKQAQARGRIRPIRKCEYNQDGVVPIVSSQRDYRFPVTSEEETLVGVLGRPDLIVTRNVEWANLAFGFEQQNKYVIMDPREPQAPVGYILEDSNVLIRQSPQTPKRITKNILAQLLGRRRPFVAQVLDANGNEIFSVRRPIWLITSAIYVEVNGKVIGQAHRRWHLWKRVYDCYLGTKQFAAVENPGFWYWTFTLHDENEGTLAVIDRNWRGFGFEFFTDAGQYVVRFGDAVCNYAPRALGPQPSLADVRLTGRAILSGSRTALNEMQQLQAAAEEAEGLDVVRPLSLLERAVVLALAVSLDNDYFSNHSGGFGFIPLPFFGGSEEVAASEDGSARRFELENDATDEGAADADVSVDSFFDDEGSVSCNTGSTS